MTGIHEALDRRAAAHLTLIEQIAAIPAPSFEEADRAAYVAERFRAAGLGDVRIDGAQNVRGFFGGAAAPARLMLAAHLDTVYPRDAHRPPARSGSRLVGSSVRDNSAGVAALVTLAAAMRDARASYPCAIEFVATAGEEGLGDLRGVRHRLRAEEARPDVVLVVDGRLGQIVHQGIAVRRFSVKLETDGGHSWGDFGAPSAVHRMASLVHTLAEAPLPAEPKTTLNVGVMRGGTSVNAVAATAEIQVDTRSLDAARVDALGALLRRLVAAEESRGARATVTVIGDRPGGRLAAGHPLVAAMQEVVRAHEFDPQLSASSTDANIPLALGIPAVSLGVAGGGHVHSPAEWLDTTSVLPGLHVLADAAAEAARIAAEAAPRR